MTLRDLEWQDANEPIFRRISVEIGRTDGETDRQKSHISIARQHTDARHKPLSARRVLVPFRPTAITFGI